MAISVVAMTVAHAAEVLHIYQAGIDTGHATFETTAPIWPVFDTDFLDEHRFVAVRDAGPVVGWVAAVAVSSRCGGTQERLGQRGGGVAHDLVDIETTPRT